MKCAAGHPNEELMDLTTVILISQDYSVEKVVVVEGQQEIATWNLLSIRWKSICPISFGIVGCLET